VSKAPPDLPLTQRNPRSYGILTSCFFKKSINSFTAHPPEDYYSPHAPDANESCHLVMRQLLHQKYNKLMPAQQRLHT
jgi:hypothetical protein